MASREDTIQCVCQPDRGVTCYYCLSASRLRIMAREFLGRGNNEFAWWLAGLAEKLEQEAKKKTD